MVSGPSLASGLKFSVEPRAAEDEQYLRVSLTFAAGDATSTIISLPHAWARETEYHRGIRALRAESYSASIAITPKPHEVVIRHRPRTSVRISYEVFPFWDAPISKENYYRPILRPTYFHFVGYGVFAVPRDSTSDHIEIEWVNIPEGWALANSFAVNQHRQIIHASLDDFRQAIYTAGDFTISRHDVAGYPLHIAVRGKWRFNLEAFRNMAQGVVRSGREFWNDFAFPHYLITMIPLESDDKSMGGTGLTDSFALFVSDGNENLDKFKFLLAHELFHTWNGQKIMVDQPEPLHYWFSEGFTDYYTQLLNLRSGLITLRDFGDALNRTLEEYYLSPVRNESNQRVLRDFWTDRDVHRLPYVRGALLAYRWNHRIKSRSAKAFPPASPKASLDEVMFDLLHEATTTGTKVSPESLDRIVRRRLPGGIRDEIRRYEEEGATVELEKGVLGPCFTLTRRTVYHFDLGFDFPEGDGDVVSGARAGGEAYRAGLRNGQIILESSIWGGRADQEVVLKVQDLDGTQKTIRYYPRGAGVEAPELVLDEERFRRAPQECMAWFKAN